MFIRFVSLKLATRLWVALFAALAFTSFAQAAAESVALRVATFNLRYASD
jgi:hypothetical protein